MRTLLFCSLIVAPTMSSAEDDVFGLSIESLLQVKINAATLTDETLRSVPSSVSVFSRKEIRRLGLRHLSELVNYVPGFQSAGNDENSATFVMSSRGRRLGSASREILVLLDGQRLNQDWSGGSSLTDTLIPLDNVERVEFIRGPGSSLYGSNAVMGVINIVTRSESSAVVEVGSHSARHGSIQWLGGSDKVRLSLFARRSQSDGDQLQIYEPNAGAPDFVDTRTPFRASDAYLGVRVGDWSVSARLSERDQLRQFYVGGYVSNEVNSVNTTSGFVNIQRQYQFANAIKLNAAIYTSWHEHQLATLLQPANQLGFSGHLHEREKGSIVTLQSDDGERQWLGGVEWRRPQLTDTENVVGILSTPSPTVFNIAPENGRTVRALFGQYQHQFGNDWRLISGLRFDHYSDFGDHLSPRLGMVHDYDADDTIKLLYSEAFRAPSRVETSVVSPGLLRNEDLKPETAKTTELVWQRQLSDGLISTTLFNTKVHNAIRESVTPALQRTWVNGSESVAGVELEWLGQWQTKWHYRLALTHIFDTALFIHSEASTLLGGSLVYDSDAWSAALLLNHQGQKRDANEQDQPIDISDSEYTNLSAHTVYGLHLQWFIDNRLETYLHIDNATDQHYLSPAVRAANVVGVPSVGRTVSVGVRVGL